jgi:MFS family permease
VIEDSASSGTSIASGAPEPLQVVPLQDEPVRRWHVGTLTYTSAGLVALFCWLLWGDFAWSMKERSVQAIVQVLLKKFQASDTTLAILIGSRPALIGIIVGPIISYRSDRHRGPWGRRIPYLVITTPIAVLGIIGLACSPIFGHWLHAWLGNASINVNHSILVFFGLFWTIFEVGTLAANAVFGGLINDVVPQRFLGRFYGLFRALSLIAGMIFNFWLFGRAEKHYAWLFLSIAALYGGGFTLMCLKVKEGTYPPPRAAPEGAGVAGGFFAAVGVYARECFSNPYYLWCFAFLNIAMLSFVPVNLFSYFYAKSLNITGDRYGAYLALTYLISLVLSYFLGVLADRFHPLRAGLVTLLLYAGATMWGGIAATNVTAFGVAFVAHGVLSGCYFTTTASLTQRLFPHARFAQFASASTAIGAAATVLIGLALGRFLDLSGHVYRYTFLISCGFAVLALVSGLIVYRQFATLGGPGNYVAPE